MAKRFGETLLGMLVFLVAILVLAPMVKRMFVSVSGFADMMPGGMSCDPGLKPCPEGYFCEQRTCVPILPRYNINQVRPNEDM
jgi:hypothetical protein